MTERYLTWRKRRKLARKEKQKKKNPVVDWLDAIGSAVVIVLLINQYLLQAYQIPSPSMVPSLLVGDRIFVNKLVYGPELIRGMLKMPGFRPPRRADVIIFESPEYISSGPLKDILQRVIYMVTLSLVDIDKDENGQPKHHFLIKRAVGMPGDRIRMNHGDVDYLLPGESGWMSEKELKGQLGLRYPIRREFSPEDYAGFRRAGVGLGLLDAGLTVPAETNRALERYFQVTPGSDAQGGGASWRQMARVDDIYTNLWRYRTLYAIRPFGAMEREQWRQLERGWYIPADRIFPMGDNRDDSRDARYFGPVRMEKVLGRAWFMYWPLDRLGRIR